jgi:molybdenum cofactor cytidylyltransferase
LKELIKITGILLASGLGVRFGQDKLLADLDGQPMFQHSLRAAQESSLERIIVVCRSVVSEKIDKKNPRISIIVNENPELGQSHSIRLALKELTGEESHVLFMLADQPLITASLIEKLVEFASQNKSLAAVNDGTRLCPPALFGRKYFDRLKNLKGDEGGRSILMSETAELIVIKDQNQNWCLDVDRIEDLEVVRRILNK